MKTTTEEDSCKATPPLRSFPVGSTFNPYKLFAGIFIPEALVKWDRISPGAKLCYGRLARFAGKNGTCYPSASTLALELGVTRRQVQTYLSDLDEKNLIRRVGKCGAVSHFEFLWHPIFSEPAPVQDTSHVKDTAHPPVQDNAHKESQGKRVPDLDKDLDIDLANRKNGASPGVFSARTKPKAKCKEYPELRLVLAKYMSQSQNPTVWPTHRQVLEIVRAGTGYDEPAIRNFICHLYDQRGLKPDTDQGPASWAWFVTVIKDAAENNKL